MARNHPRFLSCTSHNTKSPGTFIFHTLEPNILCRVHFGMKESSSHPSANYYAYYNQFALELLRPMPEDSEGRRYPNIIAQTMDHMARWLVAQINDQKLLDGLKIFSPEMKDYLKPYIRIITDEFVELHFPTEREYNIHNPLLRHMFSKIDTAHNGSGKVLLRINLT